VRSRLHMHRRRADGNDKVELSYKIADKELERTLGCWLYKGRLAKR
jgi:hypothetical protein